MNPYLKAQAEASRAANAIAQARLDRDHPNRQPCIGDAAWNKDEAAMWAQLFKDKK